MIFFLLKKVSAAVRTAFIRLCIERICLLVQVQIDLFYRGKGFVSDRSISCFIEQVNSFFYQSLVSWFIWTGGAEGGTVVLAQLVAQVCKSGS